MNDFFKFKIEQLRDYFAPNEYKFYHKRTQKKASKEQKRVFNWLYLKCFAVSYSNLHNNQIAFV